MRQATLMMKKILTYLKACLIILKEIRGAHYTKLDKNNHLKNIQEIFRLSLKILKDNQKWYKNKSQLKKDTA